MIFKEIKISAPWKSQMLLPLAEMEGNLTSATSSLKCDFADNPVYGEMINHYAGVLNALYRWLEKKKKKKKKKDKCYWFAIGN